MPFLLQRIADSAFRIFSSKLQANKSELFPELIYLINSLGLRDFFPRNNFDEVMYKSNAPIHYMHVYYNKNFSLGVFVLNKNAILPLHNHPNMHGIIKILSGKLSILAYSIECSKNNFFKDDSEKNVVKTSNYKKLTSNDDPIILTPIDNNIHKIYCEEGPAAFFDILAPPYDENEHKCTYYKEIFVDGCVKHLQPCPAPSSYFTEEIDYEGKKIIAS